MVREIKDYVFDTDTRIAVFLQGFIERDPTFTMINLFSKLKPKQLEAIFLKGGRDHLYTSPNYHTTDTFKAIVPLIKIQMWHWPHDPLTTSNPVWNHDQPHLVHRNLEYFFSTKQFGKQRPKRIEHLVYVINSLRYLSIESPVFNAYIRKMAYNMLATSVIMSKKTSKK